jgi:large subunit ribosomal protein L30
LAEQPKERKCLAVVRVRGTISASREARETLEMLHLIRNDQAVLIDSRPSFLGMLKTAQNFITWGEASKETVNLLITEKGRLAGNKKLTDEYAKRAGFKSLDGLLDAVSTCHVEYWKLPNVQTVFKLHPPSKGFRGKIKKSYSVGGELGYRGEKINELISRMV